MWKRKFDLNWITPTVHTVRKKRFQKVAKVLLMYSDTWKSVSVNSGVGLFFFVWLTREFVLRGSSTPMDTEQKILHFAKCLGRSTLPKWHCPFQCKNNKVWWSMATFKYYTINGNRLAWNLPNFGTTVVLSVVVMCIPTSIPSSTPISIVQFKMGNIVNTYCKLDW